MTHSLSLKATLLLATLLAMSTAQAANTSKADYSAGKTSITAQYKTDKAACASQSGNAKDICIAEAKGKENVARAELEHSYTGKAKDAIKAREAKVDADYSVAKEKCDDLAGNPKNVCVTEAKAARSKGMANAKMNKEIGEAKVDAAQVKRDADYKVAIEKCDALAGDAKAACVTTAKQTFGKT
ncbi:MAG: hypothetical protein ABI434_05980 [Burkholderiaceae bacterium]